MTNHFCKTFSYLLLYGANDTTLLGLGQRWTLNMSTYDLEFTAQVRANLLCHVC